MNDRLIQLMDDADIAKQRLTSLGSDDWEAVGV